MTQIREKFAQMTLPQKIFLAFVVGVLGYALLLVTVAPWLDARDAANAERKPTLGPGSGLIVRTCGEESMFGARYLGEASGRYRDTIEHAYRLTGGEVATVQEVLTYSEAPAEYVDASCG